MAGTDGSLPTAADAETGPAVVLVGPQLAENVGATARAMLNCGLGDLRLVRPRDGWPNPAAYPMASGADAVLDAARVFDSPAEAVADLRYVLATTARRRDMVKHELTAVAAAREIRRREARGERCGVLFGPERIGLTNDEIVLADAILAVPLNPAFRSLNLAQAVLIVAYEWFQAGLESPPPESSEAGLPGTGSRPATKAELLGFLEHLEAALDAAGYFRTRETRPTQVRNLRNVFQRAGLTEQEVRSLHGVVTMLVGRRKDQL